MELLQILLKLENRETVEDTVDGGGIGHEFNYYRAVPHADFVQSNRCSCRSCTRHCHASERLPKNSSKTTSVSPVATRHPKEDELYSIDAVWFCENVTSQQSLLLLLFTAEAEEC